MRLDKQRNSNKINMKQATVKKNGFARLLRVKLVASGITVDVEQSNLITKCFLETLQDILISGHSVVFREYFKIELRNRLSRMSSGGVGSEPKEIAAHVVPFCVFHTIFKKSVSDSKIVPKTKNEKGDDDE